MSDKYKLEKEKINKIKFEMVGVIGDQVERMLAKTEHGTLELHDTIIVQNLLNVFENAGRIFDNL